MTNEDLVKRFLASKAVDFKAVGNLVADLGPELAVSNLGWRMALVGRPVFIACIMPAADNADLVGELRNVNLGATLLKE